MTEDERIKNINLKAATYMQDWLKQLEDREDADDLLASLYGAMLAAYLLGYSPDAMVADAKIGAEKLIAMAAENVICPNKDENGNCPLHNLHCQYPDCEKKS